MNKENKINYTVHKESKYYVAVHEETNISSFGNTYEEAVANLFEALSLYYEIAGE